MKWKYQDDLCGCGQVETEEHVLFACNRYGQERKQLRGTIERLEDDVYEYEVIKGYHVDNDKMEKETMRYLRGVWTSRQSYERLRECGLE